MSQLPSSSTSSQRPSTARQLPSSTTSSSSQRLPSFRDMNNPIQQVFLNKTKVFNRKTYVPNLFLSRNVQANGNIEENVLPVPAKKELKNRENRRGKREQRLLAPVETFVPTSGTTRNISSAMRLRSRITSSSTKIKQENIDQSVTKRVFTKQLPTRFEKISSASSHDLPTTIPRSRPVEGVGSATKINPLLTDIMRFDGEESPLFLLKTPRYIPAVLDNSKNHPKLEAKDDKSGYKCTIYDLPEGQIGKLQILKSGNLRLVLGDCKFWLHRGVKVNFREELAIVKTDPETRRGDIISLGAIKERIIVVPDVVSKFN